METLRIGPLHFAETPFLEISGDEWQELVAQLEGAVLELGRFARRGKGPGSVVVVSAAAAARAIERLRQTFPNRSCASFRSTC